MLAIRLNHERSMDLVHRFMEEKKCLLAPNACELFYLYKTFIQNMNFDSSKVANPNAR